MNEQDMDIVRKFVVSLIKALFPNKDVIDKITESETGELLYNGRKFNGGTTIDIIAQVKKAIEELKEEDKITSEDGESIIDAIKDATESGTENTENQGESGENTGESGENTENSGQSGSENAENQGDSGTNASQSEPENGDSSNSDDSGESAQPSTNESNTEP